MQRLAQATAMTALAQSWWSEGYRVGFVPTMGYLHRGHASLMSLLRPRVDKLIVSIYVNPLQFGPNEDLATYPRDLERDLAFCAGEGVDCVFTPESLYPDGFATGVSVRGLTEGLCGAQRPGHFDGVTTVVARLFGITRCHETAFGEKDFQQLMVLRRMVRDLAMPVVIVPGPLVRDEDGLALSSRNAYLSTAERERGLSLHRALFAMQAAYTAGESKASALLELGRHHLTLLDSDHLDYLQVVDSESLGPVHAVEGSCRALVAAKVGSTHLIDNVALGPELQWT
jgi:pantoate--beta-alanine ligase